MPEVTISRPQLDDWAAWRRLYEGYAAFYGVPMDDTIAGRLWAWLHDPAHPVEALLARRSDGLVLGLAHYREMPRPLAGCMIGFLDDLFVAHEARGQGIARRLLHSIGLVAKARGWTKVRWITAEDNVAARALYDRLAVRTAWVTYEMPAAT